ncbi:NHLP bacteriocin export ABC transporter permease/ATPase subunit [Anaerotignum propionicum]|uniref:NHLP bacteriocin export ABC transporter permease/ATPase subunit n=1 Tax=Anaerotignum propionicum TaxID=28446 RepID=UPI0028A07C63|nr:NHLP bacteriocin export ABC transporter permease/ATPase subunit [Anaerotignum propionicum]
MGWFDEQIKQRIRADDDAFADVFASMAGVVMGRGMTRILMDDCQKTKNAVDEILRFYRIKSSELPAELTDINEQLEYLLRPSGVMRRVVNLEGTWYCDAVGPFLGTLKNGGVVALLPHGLSGYAFFDHERGKTVKLNKETATLLEVEAVCFYKPLPLKKLGIRDLLLYIARALSPADYTMVGIATLAVTFIGMLGPKLNNIIFSSVIENGDMRLFLAVTVMLTATGVAGLLIGTVKNIVVDQLQTKTGSAVQAASMMRVLSLPVEFFKEYSAGELSARIQSINSLSSMLGSAILTTGLTSVFSLVYLAQVFNYAPSLVVPAIVITLLTVVFTIFSTLMQMNCSQRMMKLGAKESGLIYSFISGVQKLKLSGAEKRAFSKWAELYRQKASLIYDPPMYLKLNTVISTGISLVGTIVLYYTAVKTGVSVADYFAFNIAYGMVSGAFLSLSGIALTAANIKPMFEMVKPILETVPEVSNGKKVLTRISGGIELDNVSFRYIDSMPLIVDNLSIKIRPGQYVALVGKTGCGKSTLMRLMLGFETPQKGSIYYDGKDLATVDLKSLRRRIGVVMQNGKLFSGDIFSNITITAPWLTMDEAWEAAELAGIAQDIRDMPMGMHTMISEGSGGISGGQRQRLMIARAVASKPRILMFDEATSALDNLTQKTVVDSLAKLKCTRIVIAHRLSTIKGCDRIIVLDYGKVIEDGSYDELIAKDGCFAQLVERQRLDDTEFVGKTTLF